MAPKRRVLEATAFCGRDNPTHGVARLMNLRSIFNQREAAKTGAHGGPEEHAHVEQSGGDAGGTAGCNEYLLPLLAQEPGDGGCPRRSTGRRARGQENRGVATTFASRPLTKVSASSRGRRCDTGHDNPGLQSEWCPADLLLGAPGVGVISEPVCGKVSPRGPEENDSENVRQCVEDLPDDTSDEEPKL